MALRRYGLSQRRKVVGFTQESLAEHLKVDRSTIVRWESGDSEPLPWIRPKMARALQLSVDQLTELLYPAQRADVQTELSSSEAERPDGEAEDDMRRRYMLKTLGIGAASFAPLPGIREVVLDAARSSALLRAGVETPGVSQFALIDARQRLYRLATSYALTASLNPILHELVVLRDELHATLTARQHRPADTRDLCVLLAASCVLLSSISHDLSEPYAGMTQVSAAETFAEMSGHRPLLTWVHCTKVMIASWWATPSDVLRHVEKAHTVGVVGTPSIRLAGLQARALARLGKRVEAMRVLHAAQDQRDNSADDGGLRELGEVFTFPLPRQHYYNAATHVHLGNWVQVEHETQQVARLYGAPTERRTWPVTLTLARIYQAQSRLRVHGPEGAADA